MADNKDKKVLNVPALRFPEFSGEWKKCTLAEICNIVGRIGFRGYTIQDIVEKGTGAIALSPSNITDNRLSYDKDNTYISYFKYEESPEIKVFVDDIVFVKTGSTVGKVAYVDNILCETTLNPQLVVLKNIKCNSFLLSQILSASKFQNAIKRITVGGAVPTLSQNEMGKIFVSIPKKMEQEKIATLFQLMDDRISTQNKIIEKYESLIKGLVVTHYSTIPHTIKVKIQDLGEAYSTMVMSKEQLTNDGNPCIFYGELFTLYGCVIGEIKSRTSLEKVSSTLSHGRDLLFPASTTVDALSLIAPSALMQKGIILGGDMFGIKVAETYNPIYLSYYFNYIANKRLSKYAKGTTIIHLHYNEIANVAIELPDIEEQDKIDSTILGYSTKLSVEEAILEKLSDLKQYLLKQMFI